MAGRLMSKINLIMAIDKARLEKKLGELSAAKMNLIDEAIRNSLGIKSGQ
jgi:mRNA-degrading endonuclease toxin of MazEF toxin-antitoxin module